MIERELLTEEEFYKKIERKSHLSARNHKTAVKQFQEYFLTIDLKINEQPLRILGGFTDYLVNKKLHPRTINGYVHRVKKYFRICHGVKLDSDDFKDFVSLPKILEQPLEAISKSDLRLIIDNTNKPRRKGLLFFIISTGCRISEALQIKVKDIDFSSTPSMVTFPIEITKGQRATRYQYLTKECTPLISTICNSLKENDRVFTNARDVYSANVFEHAALNTVLKNLNLDQKYKHNGRLKKSFHSIRAFTSSQIYNQTRDSEYAHAYLGHETYLNQYLRKSEEQRAFMFTEIEQSLTIFQKIQQNKESEYLKKMEKRLEIAINDIEILKAERRKIMQINRHGFTLPP